MITLHVPETSNYKKNSLTYQNDNSSLNELKLIANSRNIKAYKEKSENDLIKILHKRKPKIKFSKKKIKEIKKDFSELRYGFSKSKINEFIRSLYNLKKQKNLSAPQKKKRLKKMFLK